MHWACNRFPIALYIFLFSPSLPTLATVIMCGSQQPSHPYFVFTPICWKLEKTQGFDKLDYLLPPNFAIKIQMPTFSKPKITRSLTFREVRQFCTSPQKPLISKRTSGFYRELPRGRRYVCGVLGRC